MADQVVKYDIDYSAPPAKINRDIDAISTKLTALEQLIDKVGGKLKSLGTNAPGLAKYRSELAKLDAALKHNATDSKATEDALKKVGQGNTAVTSLTKRLADLEAELAKVTAEAVAAQAGLSGVGSGVNLPAAGGGTGAGAGGGKGTPVAGLRRAMATQLAMQGIRKVAQAAGDSVGVRHDYLTETAKASAAFREDLRPLATLKGKPSVDDALMLEQIEFQKETNLDPDEAMELRLEFGGAVAIGQAKGNISPETSIELEKQAAKFGVRSDLDMKTVGRMSGLMANYQKVPSAAAGVGVMAASVKQLDKYGVGPVPGMMAPMLGMAGSMLDEEGGRFNSFESMSARFAATTVSTAGMPSIAANQMRQTNRALRRFGGDDGPADFLRKAGVVASDSYEEALAKVAPLIHGPNGDQVLIAAGFGNEREREGLIKQSKMSDAVKRQLVDPEMDRVKDRAIIDNDAWSGTPTGRKRFSANVQFESVINTGRQSEELESARGNARGKMADPNQPGGQRLKAGIGQSILDMGNSAWVGGAIAGEDLRVDREVMANLIEGGKKVGVDVRAMAPAASYNADHAIPLDSPDSRREFNAAFGAVISAGGDPFGGTPKAAAKALRGAADALDRMKPPGGDGGGRPAPPQPPPAGNGGGGVYPGRR